MIRLAHAQDVETLTIDESIKAVARNTLEILDESYGIDRDPVKDLGGIVLILEHIDDFEVLKTYNLDEETLIPEYVDTISGTDKDWIVALILLSSDYSLTLLMPVNLAPLALIADTVLCTDSKELYRID